MQITLKTLVDDDRGFEDEGDFDSKYVRGRGQIKKYEEWVRAAEFHSDFRQTTYPVQGVAVGESAVYLDLRLDAETHAAVLIVDGETTDADAEIIDSFCECCHEHGFGSVSEKAVSTAKQTAHVVYMPNVKKAVGTHSRDAIKCAIIAAMRRLGADI